MPPLESAKRSGAGRPRDKVRALAGFYAEAAHGDEGRQGCLVVGSATELSILDAEIAARVTGALQRLEMLLQGLLRLDAGIPGITLPDALPTAPDQAWRT